jgi:hypothetical protein
LAAASGADFIDWGQQIAKRGALTWRYRDGFHPDLTGAQLLATILRDALEGPGA